MRHIVHNYKRYFKGKCLDIGSTFNTINLMPNDAVGINVVKQDDDRIIIHDLNENKLPFEDNTFDFILFSHTIEHLDSPHLILNECRRVMKEDARMIIAIPFKNSKGYNIKHSRGHTYYWNKEAFKEFLKLHDFRIVRCYYNYWIGWKICYFITNILFPGLFAWDIHIMVEK